MRFNLIVIKIHEFGDWGLGIGDWGLGQSPIHNPHNLYGHPNIFF